MPKRQPPKPQSAPEPATPPEPPPEPKPEPTPEATEEAGAPSSAPAPPVTNGASPASQTPASRPPPARPQGAPKAAGPPGAGQPPHVPPPGAPKLPPRPAAATPPKPAQRPKLSEFFQPIEESGEWLTMVIYGAAGSGKTTLAATAPDPVFLDMEGGTKSVHGTNAQVHHVQSIADLRMALDLLRTAHQQGDLPWRTVVVDTLTEMQALGLQERMIATATNPMDTQELYDVDINDYGFNSQQVRQLIREIRALPMHKVLICQESVEDNRLATIQVRPLLSRKVGEDLMWTVDAVAQLVAGEDARTLRLSQTLGCAAKVRVELARQQTVPKQVQIKLTEDGVSISPTLADIMGMLLGRELTA